MTHQGVVLQSVFFWFCVLLMITSKLVESTLSDIQDTDSKSKTAQDTESSPVSLSTSSTHRTTEILKPSQIRNRRSNLLTDKEQFIEDNAGLDSAFLYSDQIMENLLKTQNPKPLSYARSNFFLNLLKPRTTRYNAWDDHSLMHFGKRSVGNSDKVLVKRSADLWSPTSSLNLGGKPSNSPRSNESPHAETDMDIPSIVADGLREESLIDNPEISAENDDTNTQIVEELDKKSNDPWHSMMSFGKKSQNPWDHSTLHFGKKDEPWHHKMSFGKRSENPWDHSTMHFGKRNDPWHSMMSFGKKSDPWNSMMSFGKRSEISDEEELDKRNEPWHNMMSFGKKSEPWHSMMSFGKRSENPWDHHTLHFGKRDDPWHNMMSFGKKSDPWHSMMSFGKRSDYPWDHNTLHFGKRDDPWHNMMSFGKRSDYPWDHNTLHFGKKSDPWNSMMSFGKKSDSSEVEDVDKRDEPWHNMMSFGKKSNPWHSMMSFGKKSEPWHSMMSFGKRSENPWDHNTLHFGKKDDPWHNVMSFGKKSDPWNSMMSFGKRSDYPWDHNTLHFGKKDDPWHNMMSFGKRSDYPWDHNTLHFGKRNDPWHSMMSFGKRSEISDDEDLEKREDPWHNMMSFGKRSEDIWNDNATTTDKREEPWHNMMSFGKRSESDFGEHSTLHFGKREDPWHNMLSFGKKSELPWDHNTLHFGKKDEPWHNIMSFGKKSDIPWAEHSTLHFGKRDDPWHNMMSFGKRSDGMIKDDEIDFSNPWEEYNAMVFYKKNDPWDHNTLHFGKKSNASLSSISTAQKSESTPTKHIQKRSAGAWGDHQTMHFGKKSHPWENLEYTENAFESQNLDGEKSADKRFDWEPHNTMHFGKKSEPWDYHNTMHFGKKRNPWDYHSTMHFGKRDPWDYHSTMHFGKKADYENSFEEMPQNHMKNEINLIGDGHKESMKNQANEGIYGVSASENENELSVQKRSAASVMSKFKSDNNYKNNEESEESNVGSHVTVNGNKETAHQRQGIKRSLTGSEESVKRKAENINDVARKFGYGNSITPEEEQIAKPNIISKEDGKKESKVNETHMEATNEKSRISKRSIDTDKLNRESSENLDPNGIAFEEYAKDDFPDTVLHFGKRSRDIPGDVGNQLENQWLDEAEEKRFDDWNDQNALPFEKKSEPWDSHSTLHFGKKSNPWDNHYTMHFGKRNPWDYHSTMHFGKRFDPWGGHHQMHFGKRSGEWDHSVMHFGKRDELRRNLSPSTFAEDLLTLTSDPEKLKKLLEEKSSPGGMNSVENEELMERLENLENAVNFHLRDESVPFDEKLSLLKSYLKPILKTILSGQNLEVDVGNPALDPKEYMYGDLNNNLVDEEEKSVGIPTRTIVINKNYEEMLPNDGETANDGEHDENSKWMDYLKKYKDYLKSKRATLGKPELKRYFVPFQGPKSIVYPHAWFASQIRRSTLPRTTDFARSVEMRMAEKKEDPFNSYMHFGRR